MPTPSPNQPPEAPVPHVVTCPDDSQLSPRPGWNLDEHGARSEDHDVNMEVRDESDSAPAGEMIGVRDGAVIHDVVMEQISAESSSRATTMSPRLQSHETIDTSPISSDADRNTTKTSELLEDGLSRSTELKTNESVPNQSRVRASNDYLHEQDSSSTDGEDDFCSLSMGIDYPTRRTRPTLPSSFLRPGSRFHGTQQSERQVYDVQVEIKHVDMHESFLCGYLRIQGKPGLTEDHPTLTTYFEGEIIGSKHNFFTQHDDWGANHKVDLSHWSKFSAFRPYQKHARRGPVAISDVAQRENIFMRWKEHFLVPDHRVRTISGASFEGFYYICFNQIRGEVSGIYFHSKSEKFQQLELKHVPDRGCFNAVEFR
ncbi:unnamed protein product [Clonostachys chloroleuca]|uniref:Uncharacterized protein n=1 Tax=Clonostachys chloroleuca TaxID=1926264 RepID=A0AA35LZB9_9HYPO|nr:unnamed protein product [Clonostachys chloroleuca]